MSKKIKCRLKLYILVLIVVFVCEMNICCVCAETTSEVPVVVSDTLTEYTPWFENYHLLTDVRSAGGKRGGMGGQRIYDIEVSPFDTNNRIFATDTTGVYISRDGGKSWFVASEGIKSRACFDVAYDSHHSGVVYAVMNSGFSGSYDYFSKYPQECGIFKSYDNGLSWEHIYTGFTNKSGICTSGLIDFDDFGNVYVYLSEGVLKSSDDGLTWSNLGVGYVGKENYNSQLWVSDDGNTIIAANNTDGISASFDGGNSWERRAHDTYIISFAVDPDNNAHWYATSDITKGHLFESTDSGKTWNDLGAIYNNGLVSGNSYTMLTFGAKNSDGIRRMFISGNGVSRGARYSDDAGRTWKEIVFLNGDGYAKGCYWSASFSVDPNDENTIYFASENGINISTDNGDSWFESTGGFSGHCVRQFQFDEEGYLWASMHDFAVYKSATPFIRENNSYPNVVMLTDKMGKYDGSQTVGDIDADPRDSQRMYAAIGKYASMIITETKDGGITWNQISGTEGGRVRLVRFNNKNPDIIYTSFYVSRNDGQTWEKTPCSIGAVCEADNNIIAGTSEGYLYLSKDCGITWEKTYIGIDGNNIIFDDSDCDTVWISGGDGSIVKVCRDIVTKYSTSNGLGTKRLYQVAQNPFDPAHLLAVGTPIYDVTGDGLYESIDYGKTWHIVPGIPGPKCLYSVTFSPFERIAVIGSYMGTFIYRYDNYFDYLNRREVTISADNSDDNRELSATAIYYGICRNTTSGNKHESLYDSDKAYGFNTNIALGTVFSDDSTITRDSRMIYKLDLQALKSAYIKKITFNFKATYWSDGAKMLIQKYNGDVVYDKTTYNSVFEKFNDNIDDRIDKTVIKTDGDSLVFSVDVTDLFDYNSNCLSIICKALKDGVTTVPWIHSGGFIEVCGGNTADRPYFVIEYFEPDSQILFIDNIENSNIYEAEFFCNDISDEELVAYIAAYKGETVLLKADLNKARLDKFNRINVKFDLSSLDSFENVTIKSFLWRQNMCPILKREFKMNSD